MKNLMLWFAAFAVLATGVLRAQDLTGTWQGTLKTGRELRIILVVSKEDGQLKAKLYSMTKAHDRL